MENLTLGRHELHDPAVLAVHQTTHAGEQSAQVFVTYLRLLRGEAGTIWSIQVFVFII